MIVFNSYGRKLEKTKSFQNYLIGNYSHSFSMDRNPEFKSAAEIPVIEPSILHEYYTIKVELEKLLKKEEELKEIIKNTMIANNKKEIITEYMNLFCKKTDRTLYPKQKVEQYVPAEILEKIKTVQQVIILTTRMKQR